MKKQLITLLGATLLSAAVMAAPAQSTAAKIGVVNVQKIFDHSAAVKATKAKLKEQFESKKSEVQSAAKALNAMIANYKKNASTLQPSERADMQKKIAAKQSSILAMESSFQQQAAKAEQEAMQKFVKRIQSVSKNVAAKEHLDIILPEHTLLYSDNKLDVTKEVAEQFND